MNQKEPIMNLKLLFLVSIVLSFLLNFTGAMFKVMHWPYSDILLSLGILFTVILLILGVYDLFSKSTRKNKFLYLIGFIFMS